MRALSLLEADTPQTKAACSAKAGMWNVACIASALGIASADVQNGTS
jgi:hypothetical protein